MNAFLPLILAGVSSLVLSRVSWAEEEVGFIEKFALAADREKALAELVPGSEDYYFFHALHYQNTRNAPKLTETLKQWAKRFPEESDRRREIMDREALLNYDKDAKGTLRYLKERLGLEFNHEREVRDAAPDLPEKLDAALIARAVFEADALANDNSLESFSQSALERLVPQAAKLNDQQRAALLQKLQRPDVEGLVPFLAEELKASEGSDFGKWEIHKELLPEQLDALAKLVPTLVGYTPFVFTKLRKLAPGADEDVEFDAKAREAWLDRVWAYAQTLPTAFNTVKASVLYRRLDHDRKRGVYDAARFGEYLKLPRAMGYVNEKWLAGKLERESGVDFNAGLGDALLVERPIGNDEPLVREYFLELFAKGAAWEPYADLVRETWLKPVFAEAMITHGKGKAEEWASLLSPAEFARLKERVDIEFPATNSQFTQPGDDVAFDVVLKNTPKLLVRIYEINTLNFYQTEQRQLNTDVKLDGLVANSERTEEMESGPFVRTRKTFTFPELKGKRGAWVVEFIGGGRSSRALIRVGQWQVLQQTGAAGVLLTVIDEKKQPVPDAAVWLDGRKFTRDEKTGVLTVPFSAIPGPHPLVVSDAAGSFASLTEFQHSGEEYTLDAHFHIKREQLLAGRKATLAVRTDLLLGELHLDPALLQEPKLTITSTTHDGISTTREVKDLKLRPDAVLTYELAVPERLKSLTVKLTGKMDVLSKGGEKKEVEATRVWTLNGIDKTAETNAGHLSKFGGNYVYELLGKNGEPLADRQVELEFTHEGFERPTTASLKTDAKGRIMLGALAGISYVKGPGEEENRSQWALSDFQRTWPTTLNAKAGEAVRLPLPPKVTLPEVSLLEMKADTFTANHAAKLKVLNGFLVIEALPPGDYSLRLRGDGREVSIRVTEATRTGAWLLGATRNLQQRDAAPLHIGDVVEDKEFLTVKLANVTPFTRVHIAATRFYPGMGLFNGLGSFKRTDGAFGTPGNTPNLFSTGREIGDEYRYILERRYTKLFPGNMLARPGLLLNPWEVRETGTTELSQAAGAMEGRVGAGRSAAMGKNMMKGAGDGLGLYGAVLETNRDFLAEAAPVLYNLVPDKDGVVRIERKALGDRQHVQVYAEDATDAVWRSFALAEQATKFADQRLVRNLDPARAFTQKKQVTVLEKGKALTLADILTSELETYDTLGGIYTLFTTMSSAGDGKLEEFAWLLEWPQLKDEEKRAKYSEFACHELSFFLSRKDPAFFDAVVKPYLANKKDRTFMDDFLLAHDLSAYREPWAYERLNAVERILLATRIPGEPENAARRLREQWEMIPPDVEEQDRLFETALHGRSLAHSEGGVGADLGEARDEAKPREFLTRNPSPAMPEPASPEAGDFPTPKTAPVMLSSGSISNIAAKAKRSLSLSVEESEVVRDALKREGKGELKERSVELGRELNDFGAVADKRVYFRRLPGTDATGAFVAEAAGEKAVANFAFVGADAAAAQRVATRIYYRQLGVTKEWAENNYYKLRIADQGAELVTANAFWRDYAKHVADGAKTPFVSEHVAEAASGFTEMMLALAVLDLPFAAPKHTTKTEGGQFTLTAAGPVLVYHKEVKPAAPAVAEQAGLMVSQSFYRHDDRYRQEGNEQFEKVVTEEFLTGVVYGASVAVTNPTSAPVKAEVLLQIPQGALPVLGSKATGSLLLRLVPYTTQTFEYAFYFPSTPAKAGAKFPHYPVNVAIGGKQAASAKPFEFNVVGKLTQFDKASWDYVSQYGTAADVFTFLAKNNLEALDLERVAWRCKDAAFFKKLTAFLNAHHVWDETIYSYAVVHNDAAALREWLKHNDEFVAGCGSWLSSKLVVLDPIERRAYEHLEYSPLVNQRAHRVGSDWRIANPAIHEQYTAFLDILAHKPKLDAADTMSTAYYLFLQDRNEEALARFHSVDAKALPTQLQHDYFRCYADFYEGNLADARTVAAKYADHPIARWRTLFGEVSSQLDEIEGKAPAGKGDKPDREKQQAELAATEPTFDFKVEKQSIALTYKNVGEVTVNYYLMDPEFSFSSSPFASEDASRFSIIKPNKTATQPLAKDKDTLDLALPAEFAKANVLVELVAAGQRKAHPYHANTLKLALTENYGRLEARDLASDKPIPRAYVKVYARLKNGTVRFYKDGYTDLRGRFDYASLNGGGHAAETPAEPAPKNGLDYQMLKPAELGSVEKLAILILSDTNGATTREVKPPGE